MSNLPNAEIKITLADYQSLVDARTAAETEAARLRQEVIDAKLSDPSERVEKLAKLARKMWDVGRFAIANLTPAMSPGWPHEALLYVCQHMEDLPDAGADDMHLADDLLSFVAEAKEHEDRRALERAAHVKAKIAKKVEEAR